MDRRKSLKLIATGAIGVPALLAGCKTEDKKNTAAEAIDGIPPEIKIDRYKEELVNDKKLLAQGQFFTDEELATITVLSDIIIPRDAVSGSASDANVPAFVDFIVKDLLENQVPMRGGLRWLDMQCLTRFNKTFTSCSKSQQIEMVDAIAYPARVKPGMEQGVAFFNLLRNFVATGFYTSEEGWKDVGYMGNTPNQWKGVPDDVLKQYGLAYSERELKESI